MVEWRSEEKGLPNLWLREIGRVREGLKAALARGDAVEGRVKEDCQQGLEA
jgi:hypothetical protein